MGISGLLPLLKSIQVHRHLSDFAGQTLAVDAYVWLHRGVYSCATELATGKNSTKLVLFRILWATSDVPQREAAYMPITHLPTFQIC
jgi:hypothetical protein